MEHNEGLKMEYNEVVNRLIKKSAVESGRDYFENVKDVLQNALLQVESDQKQWEKAINDEPYPDQTTPAPNDLKVKRIEWTVDYLRQINLRPGDAVRAVAKLAVAFNIEF